MYFLLFNPQTITLTKEEKFKLHYLKLFIYAGGCHASFAKFHIWYYMNMLLTILCSFISFNLNWMQPRDWQFPPTNNR